MVKTVFASNSIFTRTIKLNLLLKWPLGSNLSQYLPLFAIVGLASLKQTVLAPLAASGVRFTAWVSRKRRPRKQRPRKQRPRKRQPRKRRLRKRRPRKQRPRNRRPRNDDRDGVARRIKRLEGYRRREIRGCYYR